MEKTEVIKLHAKLSPSSSDRWLQCPASIFRAPETEEEGSEAAHEGTVAHAFAEYCLKNNLNGMAASFPAEHASYNTPELRMNVQRYLEYVMRLKGKNNGTELFVEQKLHIFKEFEVFGTADAVLVTTDGVIHVIDLKYGKGILVDVEDNTQLLLYGVGGLAFDWLSSVPVHTIVVHIVQPRRENLVSKEYSVEELGNWVKENQHLVKRAYDGTNEANPGAHCKWCPIKGTCRERAEMNLKLASFDFEAAAPACTELGMLTDDELVTVFLNIKLFRDWLDDVETEVAKMAHLHVPDRLKWVAGRSTRVVKDVDVAANLLGMAGVHPWQPQKLLGITEIEKQLKFQGKTVEDVLGKVVEKIAGKPALVSAADKREAITPIAAAVEDFN